MNTSIVVEKVYLYSTDRVYRVNLKLIPPSYFPVNIQMFKVNNRNFRKRCEICPNNNNNTRTTSRRRAGIFIVNFEHISYVFLVFLLLTLSK